MTEATPAYLKNDAVRRTDLAWDDWPAIHAFLKDELICHIAVNGADAPYMAALSYTFTGTQFLLHSSRHGLLAKLLREQPIITLQVDRAVALLKAPKGQNTSLEYYSVIARCETNFREVVEDVHAHQMEALDKFRPERDYIPPEVAAAAPIVAYRCTVLEMSAKKRILADGQYSPPGLPQAPYLRYPFQKGACISGLGPDAFDKMRFRTPEQPT
jgi:nitroimidazol reductase NimA-like FMN-containing flavoprotein (pyridoxamine 5'-phosphate oxidase superfamily)